MTEDTFICRANQYMDMIFRLAFNYLKNASDAEDVTQDVLLKLYQTDRDFESEEHLRNWLIRVTSNECKNLFRSFWWKRVSLGETAEQENGSGEHFSPPDTDEAGDLLSAVMRLPAKYRVVLYLYYYEGYDTRDIAGLLELPPGTVRTRLSRGREKLRKYWTEV